MKNPRYSMLALGLVFATVLPVSLGGGLGGSGLPYTFSSGTPALADEVNENFAAVTAGVNAVTVELELLASRTVDAERVVRVATEGGDFSSIREALASIPAATEVEPVVVLVYPGSYEETQTIRVPSNVHLKGLDSGTTFVGASAGLQTISLTGENARLSGLTVEVRSPSLGVQVTSDHARIEDIRISSALEFTKGVAVLQAEDVLLRRLDIDVQIQALECKGGSVTVEDSELRSAVYGVFCNQSGTTVEVRNCTLIGEIGASCLRDDARIRLDHCSVATLGSIGVSAALGGSVFAASTKIQGNTSVDATGSIRLVQCYDEQFESIPDQTIE